MIYLRFERPLTGERLGQRERLELGPYTRVEIDDAANIVAESPDAPGDDILLGYQDTDGDFIVPDPKSADVVNEGTTPETAIWNRVVIVDRDPPAPERCDECEAEVPADAESHFGHWHGDGCSLHSDNEVALIRTARARKS